MQDFNVRYISCNTSVYHEYSLEWR